MSRYPVDKTDANGESIIEDYTIKVICQSIYTTPFVEGLPVVTMNILDVIEDQGQPMAQIELLELRQQQRKDPVISVWLRAVIEKSFPRNESSLIILVIRLCPGILEKFEIIRGVLYRSIVENDEAGKHLVLQAYIETQFQQDCIMMLFILGKRELSL